MRSTLWVFGDSFTTGDGCIETRGIRDGNTKYYYEYKKIGDDIWPNHLGKMLNLNIKNYGISGASNDKIIDKIIDESDNFKKNDLVVIQKTFSQRFDIPHINGLQTHYGESLNTMSEDLKNNPHIKDKLKLETILNYGVLFSDNILFKERQDKRFNFIKNSVELKVLKCYMWDIFDFLSSYENIFQHTGGRIKDSHLSFNGHKRFADNNYKLLSNNKTLI
jgi:hypothetical protein